MSKTEKNNLQKQNKENKENGQVYGYLRVSTEAQKLINNRQRITDKKNDLQLSGDIIWIEEKVSGLVNWKERELGKLVDNLKSGDVIIMSELSRISRNGLEITEFISVVLNKGAQVFSLDMQIPIDNSPMSLMFISGIAAGAQMERDNISIRTKAALQQRKNAGQVLGRPKGSKSSYTKLSNYKEDIARRVLLGVPYKRIAKDFKVTPQTMSKFIHDNNLKPKTP